MCLLHFDIAVSDPVSSVNSEWLPKPSIVRVVGQSSKLTFQEEDFVEMCVPVLALKIDSASRHFVTGFPAFGQASPNDSG